MLFDEIETSRNYGARETPQSQSPFFRVRVLEKIRRRGGNQIKVRHLDDPQSGLEEYLKPAQIIAPWGDVRSILRDEQRLRTLDESITSAPDQTVEWEVETIFAAAGDQSIWCRPTGIVECDPDSVQRVADRAHAKQPVRQLASTAFVDRHGTLHLPFAALEEVARAFAEAEPETVNLYIDGQEETSFARAAAPYADFERKWYLSEEKPGWELARQ